MEENKNSDEHGNDWAANILCVCWKKRTGDGSQWTVHKQFANPLLITGTPLANIVFANMFGKFIFPQTSVEPGENEEPTAWQSRENCWLDRKIYPRTWKRTKMQTNTVLTEPQISFEFVEKIDRRWFAMNCSQTVWKPHTNYMNIVFANKMFASVYTALSKFWKTHFRILAENFEEMLEILRTFLTYKCVVCFGNEEGSNRDQFWQRSNREIMHGKNVHVFGRKVTGGCKIENVTVILQEIYFQREVTGVFS